MNAGKKVGVGMYLEHFNLKEMPFSLTPNTDFYCHLPTHDEALKTLLFSINEGDGFIKIIAEVGVGKTLLCRKLLNTLCDDVKTCYIPNPDLTPDAFRQALAIELGMELDGLITQHALIKAINDCLLRHHAEGRRVVLVVDEAQALSVETLETLRLLTNLETESSKLLQIVLFGQPELQEKLNQPSLRQLQQRIIFSYYVKPLGEDDIDKYLSKRLIAAGHCDGIVFNYKARVSLLKMSKGIPRVLNILAHKSMIVACGNGDTMITDETVKKAAKDSSELLLISSPFKVMWVQKPWRLMASSLAGLFGVSFFIFHYVMR